MANFCACDEQGECFVPLDEPKYAEVQPYCSPEGNGTVFFGCMEYHFLHVLKLPQMSTTFLIYEEILTLDFKKLHIPILNGIIMSNFCTVI